MFLIIFYFKTADIQEYYRINNFIVIYFKLYWNLNCVRIIIIDIIIVVII